MKKPASATVCANVIATEMLRMVGGGMDRNVVPVQPETATLKAERVQ